MTVSFTIMLCVTFSHWLKTIILTYQDFPACDYLETSNYSNYTHSVVIGIVKNVLLRRSFWKKLKINAPKMDPRGAPFFTSNLLIFSPTTLTHWKQFVKYLLAYTWFHAGFLDAQFSGSLIHGVAMGTNSVFLSVDWCKVPNTRF